MIEFFFFWVITIKRSATIKGEKKKRRNQKSKTRRPHFAKGEGIINIKKVVVHGKLFAWLQERNDLTKGPMLLSSLCTFPATNSFPASHGINYFVLFSIIILIIFFNFLLSILPLKYLYVYKRLGIIVSIRSNLIVKNNLYISYISFAFFSKKKKKSYKALLVIL